MNFDAQQPDEPIEAPSDQIPTSDPEPQADSAEQPQSESGVSETTDSAEQSGTDKKGKTIAIVRKVFSITLNVLLYAFLALGILVLILSVSSKRDKMGGAKIFGYEMRVVVSPSMEKSENSVDVSNFDIKDIPVKSMVFIDCIPDEDDQAGRDEFYASLKVGDVLTFVYYEIGDLSKVITHRIVAITKVDEGYIIDLKGDNRASENGDVTTQTIYTSPSISGYDPRVDHLRYVIGKVTGQSVVLGNIVYAVRQPVGLVFLIIVPCAIIIIWQIVRVVLVLYEDKKKKAQQKLEELEQAAEQKTREAEAQAAELEELRRRFAELEAQNSGNGESNDSQGKT